MPTAKKLPSGSWRCQAYLGRDEKGRVIRRSFTAKTKKEAERLAAVASMDADLAAVLPVSFLAAARAYVDRRRGVLSPWTVSTYTRIISRDFLPLHDVPVSSLTSQRVQAFVSDFALDHAPKTVSSVYGLLSSILADAAPDLRLHVRLPQRRPSELAIPDQEQVAAMIDASSGDLRAAIILASSMGLRRAEISALQWRDVSGSTLSVRRAYAKDDQNTLVLKSPKSAAGSRSLQIPPAALPVLTPPSGADPDDRIVPLTPDAITRRFERLCASLGVSFHFHALRHYYASVLLSLGVPDKYAMSRMGHSTPAMLKQVYQHIMSDKSSSIDDQLSAYFSASAHASAHDP